MPAAADEWGSGWGGDASGNSGSGRLASNGSAARLGQSAPAPAQGDAQWSGWDEGAASPSHQGGAPLAGGKKEEDALGKW